MNKSKLQQILIDIIDERIKKYIKTLAYDKTLYGKVISVSGKTAVVEINDTRYTCAIDSGTPTVGTVIKVYAPNSDYKRLYISL